MNVWKTFNDHYLENINNDKKRIFRKNIKVYCNISKRINETKKLLKTEASKPLLIKYIIFK